MKFTPFIAAAILAFVAAPTHAIPLTPATLNQSNVEIQTPGIRPISVSIDGLMIPGPIYLPSTEMTSSGLPFDSHPGNLEDFPYVVNDIDGPTKTSTETQDSGPTSANSTGAHHRYRPRPRKHPLISDVMIDGNANSTEKPKFNPWGLHAGHGPVINRNRSEHRHPSTTVDAQQMHPGNGFPKFGHGPVIHSGFRTIAFHPNPTIFSNRTGGPLRMPIVIPTDAHVHIETQDGHRLVGHAPSHHVTSELHKIGPRDVEHATPLSNNTSAIDEELRKYVMCMNNPVEFRRVLAHMMAVEEAFSKQVSDYESNHTHDNATDIIFKGLRFKADEEIGIKLLATQHAQDVRDRLCQARYGRNDHGGSISRREISSAELEAVEQEWMAIEAPAIEFASATSEIDPAAFNFQRLVLAIAREFQGRHKDRASSKPNVAKTALTSETKFPKLNSTATKEQYPEIINFKDHIIDANNITDSETQEEVMRTIDEALESIAMSDKFEHESTENAPDVGTNSNLNGRSMSVIADWKKPADPTEFMAKVHRNQYCSKNGLNYLSKKCKEYREENAILRALEREQFYDNM